ncbi:hypothetical protein SAMN06265222_10218 [Neorhodopirellula lusitana]|uniref:Uncharacterized protein n=1 Tax=Neorhodopirellula lusitana TaxID=445327 RepID=A0ABY1PV46_9BACT|nr:hypothetical protein [Neorhodopirellula lusitana]SMP45888.1 hypothetical protein SAMN06265222_10218 [Neorhodopirellula lusitana]
MLFYVNWIERGFQVHHKPGVSRAWVRAESDGRQLILTDLGGFDLPSRDGPFQACVLSADNVLLDGPVQIPTRLALARWLRDRSDVPIPTDPRM